MPRFIVYLVSTLLLTLPGLTQACALISPTPAEIFKNYGSVFVARPLAMSPAPEEIARLPTNAPYQQTVIWKIERVWKGDQKAGETFVTTRRFEQRVPCSGWGVTNSYDAQVFSLEAGNKFHQHYGLPAAPVVLEFDTLQQDENSRDIE